MDIGHVEIKLGSSHSVCVCLMQRLAWKYY